jgi:2-amino-4-hydroxy-6-hydroxymethyldihydropteridine diphosphokinase
MRHHRLGARSGAAARRSAALGGEGCKLVAASPIIASGPLGPSLRRYANAAAS